MKTVLLLIKRAVAWAVNSLMEKRGLRVFRVQQDHPPKLDTLLAAIATRHNGIDRVYCFDGSIRIQNELLSLFPPTKVTFASHAMVDNNGRSGALDVKEPRFGDRFLVLIDPSVARGRTLAMHFPWVLRAEAIVLRATPALFWCDQLDLWGLCRWWRSRGFELWDVVGFESVSRLNAQSMCAIIAFVRAGAEQRVKPPEAAGNEDPVRSNMEAQARCGEALAFLSEPLATSNSLIRLTGRGSFGYQAGVLNPGAIELDDKVFLVARGERIPWPIASRREEDFFSDCQPIIFELNDRLQLGNPREAVVHNAPPGATRRFEDFRLFRFDESVFSNHSMIMRGVSTPDNRRPLAYNDLRVGVGLSRLDLDSGALVYAGEPLLDLPTRSVEKNWVFFSRNERLFLLYSFSPYRLLVNRAWPSLKFETVVCRDSLSGLPAVNPLRNSINPVEYDDKHLLHVVHCVYPEKQYVFWAVLIEKQTLIPVAISGRPLVTGWGSARSSLVYVTAVLTGRSSLLVLGGLDDSSIGVWRVNRASLDASWQTVS